MQSSRSDGVLRLSIYEENILTSSISMFRISTKVRLNCFLKKTGYTVSLSDPVLGAIQG